LIESDIFQPEALGDRKPPAIIIPMPKWKNSFKIPGYDRDPDQHQNQMVLVVGYPTLKIFFI